MAERYSKLYLLKENQYTVGSPVIIKAGALLLDTVNAKTLVQLKFRSLAERVINELSVIIYLKDASGEPLGEPVAHNYIELSAERSAEFGAQKPVYLPEADARSFAVEVKKVKFFDGTEYTGESGDTVNLSMEQTSIEGVINDSDAVAEYRDTICINAKYATKREQDLWYCSCGAINRTGDEECHACGASLEKMETANPDELKNEHIYKYAASALQGDESTEKYQNAIKAYDMIKGYKDADEKAEVCRNNLSALKARQTKNKKIAAIVASALACVLVVIMIITNVIVPSVQLGKAEDLIAEGDDAAASEILYFSSSIQKHKYDEAQVLLDEIYERADATANELISKGDYQDAYDFLLGICGFSGSEYADAYDAAYNLKEGRFSEGINLSGVTEIVIPAGTTEIADNAFSGCAGLTKVTIPSSITSVGSGAFSGCSGLIELTLPSGVTKIGASAFSGCSSLTSLSIPSAVTEIGASAFKNCTSLTSITIPSGVKSIGESMFYGCKNLEEVNIPSEVKTVEKLAFSNCEKLTGITLPNALTSIGASAFAGCSGLTSISLPSGLAKIGGYAFDDCIKLTSVNVPNSVTEIGSSAFAGCSGLTSITLPFVGKSATSTSNEALFGYIFGTSSYVGGTSTKQYYSSYSSRTYYIPTSLKTVTVNGGNLAYGAFYACGAATVTLNNVDNIGTKAFCYSDITTITFNGVKTVSDDAFYNCSDLTRVNTPSIEKWCAINFASSDANPLYYAKKLYCDGSVVTSVNIPSGVTKIGSYVFYGCTGIKSITIPSGVTGIGNGAFSGCTSLTSVKYRGTQSQWDAISKTYNWDWDTSDYTITYNYTGN